MSENKFTSISVSKEDYAFYDQIRRELSEKLKEQGMSVKQLSMAEVLKVGMTFYNQRRKLNMTDKSDEA